MKKSGKSWKISRIKNYPSGIGEWQRFEKNNPAITRNVLYVQKYKYPVVSEKYISCQHFKAQLTSWAKHSFNDSKQRSMSFYSIKSVFASSKHDSDFYCLSCLHFFQIKNKFESHKKVCENKNHP